MKFSAAALSLVALAGVTFAITVDKTFGLITVHSGSPVNDYIPSVASDGTLEVNPQNNQNWFLAKFNSDGFISFGDKYLAVRADGSLSVTSDKSDVFSENESGHLVYKSSTSFIARKTADDVYKIIRPSGNGFARDDVSVVFYINYQG